MKTKHFSILLLLCLSIGLYSCGGSTKSNFDETTLVAPSGDKIFKSEKELNKRIKENIMQAHGEAKKFEIVDIDFMPGFEKGYFAIISYQVDGIEYVENFTVSNSSEE